MNPATKIKQLMILTKVNFSWWNPTRKIEDHIKDRMTAAVHADSKSINASKHIYSNKLECIKEINSLRSEIKDWWETTTDPHPESGCRLLLKTDLDMFEGQLTAFKVRLDELAYAVQCNREAILAEAKERLQEAFQAKNYPANLAYAYQLTWSYPAMDPDKTLEMNPKVFQQEKARINAQLTEAANLIEQTFAEELAKLVNNLNEALVPDPDGKPKVFRNSTLNNFGEFFTRFQKLNVTNNEELETLVAETKGLLAGLAPKELRDHKLLRTEVATSLAKIADQITPFVQKGPRRKIIGVNSCTQASPSSDSTKEPKPSYAIDSTPTPSSIPQGALAAVAP